MKSRKTLSWTVGALLAVPAAFLSVAALAPAAWAPPGPVAGVTPIAQDAKVVLAWSETAGASSYAVYRGTSPGAVTQLVAGAVGTPSFTDTDVANGTTYFYSVVANSGSGASPASTVVSATPRAASCSSGNRIAVENCFPGSGGWKPAAAYDADHDGIEGFTTATSIAAGEAVDLKVRVASGTPYHVDVYRTGWYAGDQGRLIGRVTGLTGVEQPSCTPDFDTGALSCAGWAVATRLTTTADWTSGVYVLKLVRDDNGAANYTILAVRDDSRTAAGLYVVPVSTYQAYNPYGGRSLYSWNSSGNPTVSGGPRAVKVSFDRPYNQSVSKDHDFYTISDLQTVGWLERQGYDLSYADNLDLDAGRGDVAGRRAVILGSHDEYVSAAERDALTAARDGGVNIASFGANGSYWKVRYEDGHRTLVCYKTTESGASDPVAPTTTWRDPTGANLPENSLLGAQYVGDNSAASFPMFVTAAQGKHRLWRYTSLASLAPGAQAQVDYNVIGWEWDRRVDNGQGPAGVEAISSSPVSGNILQDAGRVYSPGPETAEATTYTAAGGARVFNAGTNQWSLGLGYNIDHAGEPDAIIQQGTANVLADAGLNATTPSGVTVDASGDLQVSDRTPAAGATGVAADGTMRVTFDRALDPGTVTGAQLTVVRTSDGTPAPGAVTYDGATHAIRFTPDEAFDGLTGYTVHVGTGLHGWNGHGLASALTWSFTTGPGTPPVVASRSPASGSTTVGFGDVVTARFNRHLDAATVTGASFTLTSAAGSVAATVAYDDASRTATLTPDAPLSSDTLYTARVTTAVKAHDGTPKTADDAWSFRTFNAVAVTSHTPGTLASGISSRTQVRAILSRSIDASTLTTTSFTLRDPNGSAVAADLSWNAAARAATLAPVDPLAAATTYTATIADTIRAIDGAPLAQTTQWTFTTGLTDPPAPVATTLSPTDGATGAPLDQDVDATFDRPLDAGTVTTSSLLVTGPGGTPIAGAVSYDAPTNTIRFSPASPLALITTYSIRVTSAVRSAVGQPLAGDLTWSFTTGDCPCSTMATVAPTEAGMPVQDGRGGGGPFTLEAGVKLRVDQAVRLLALRYYKSPGETGTHTARLWTAGGGLIASPSFSGETASGWQQADLDHPVTLRPGRTYVASVGLHAFYVVTRDQLASERAAGPLRTLADGANGLFANEAGEFPTQSWRNSNYFIDAVVDGGAGIPQTPAVSSYTPLDGAAGVTPTTTVKAGFTVPLDASTVNASTFTLRPQGGSAVAATVTYDEATERAKLTPSAPLDPATTYVAQLGTGVESNDGSPLASAVSWTFTTAAGGTPHATALSPVDDATQLSGTTTVRATFSQALDPATVTSSNVLLTGPSGTVTATVGYDSATMTAVLTPDAPLAAATAYTATVGTGVQSAGGVPLTDPVTWNFTTSACPCRLFAATDHPDAVSKSVQDGRSSGGPYSYEMGVKVQVTQAAQLTAIRYYKSPGEGGAHVGRVWASDGSLIAYKSFTGENASGWQEQALTTPLTLTPGTTYTVSVGINDYYVVTLGGLGSAIAAGPLTSVADGANGVFGSAAGSFPADSWGSSNYFVDAVVR